MTSKRPSLESLLSTFFDRELDGKVGVTRRRIELLETSLRNCLEAEGHRVLVTRDLVLLAAERQFQPDGAMVRIAHADDLIYVLTLFVEHPWLAADRTDRRTQLRVTEHLAGWILARDLVNMEDLMCPLLDLRAGLDRGRRDLRASRQSDDRTPSR